MRVFIMTVALALIPSFTEAAEPEFLALVRQVEALTKNAPCADACPCSKCEEGCDCGALGRACGDGCCCVAPKVKASAEWTGLLRAEDISPPLDPSQKVLWINLRTDAGWHYNLVPRSYEFDGRTFAALASSLNGCRVKVTGKLQSDPTSYIQTILVLTMVKDDPKVAACECGCEQTGKCLCKNCDNHSADKNNPGARGKVLCVCGCVETGQCACPDCNHVKAAVTSNVLGWFLCTDGFEHLFRGETPLGEARDAQGRHWKRVNGQWRDQSVRYTVPMQMTGACRS
jgi:hypothetical protein